MKVSFLLLCLNLLLLLTIQGLALASGGRGRLASSSLRIGACVPLHFLGSCLLYFLGHHADFK